MFADAGLIASDHRSPADPAVDAAKEAQSYERELVASEGTFTNPRRVSWGTAPVLVRATTTPGTIRVRARVVFQGKHTPLAAELEIPTFPADHEVIADPSELEAAEAAKGVRSKAPESSDRDLEREVEALRRELNALKLREVERQQSDFE